MNNESIFSEEYSISGSTVSQIPNESEKLDSWEKRDKFMKKKIEDDYQPSKPKRIIITAKIIPK